MNNTNPTNPTNPTNNTTNNVSLPEWVHEAAASVTPEMLALADNVMRMYFSPEEQGECWTDSKQVIRAAASAAGQALFFGEPLPEIQGREIPSDLTESERATLLTELEHAKTWQWSEWNTVGDYYGEDGLWNEAFDVLQQVMRCTADAGIAALEAAYPEWYTAHREQQAENDRKYWQEYEDAMLDMHERWV